jgi:hypothetical protein
VLAALAGLAWYLFSRKGRRFRILGIVFLTAFGILLLNPHSKPEYLAAAYPPLFAGGGLLFARLTDGRWCRAGRGLAGLLIAMLVAFGAVVAPLAMPILPVADYVRYARALGVAPTTAENKTFAELPQFFADMHGWEDLAREVSTAYLSIPEEERDTTVALVGTTGRREHSSCSRATARCHA